MLTLQDFKITHLGIEIIVSEGAMQHLTRSLSCDLVSRCKQNGEQRVVPTWCGNALQ